LWHQIRKTILDKNVDRLVKRLLFKNLINPKLRCFNCDIILDWLYYEENNDNITYGCTSCPEPHKLLQCLPKDINLLMSLSKQVHPQLFAPVLHALMYHITFLNRFRSPSEVDNPLQVVQEIFRSSPETFKLGGPNVVILMDIHFGSKPFNCPIIYLADTEIIPTKMVLFPLDMVGINDETTRDQTIIKHFVQFVQNTNIVNKRSNLVIGPNLEKIMASVNLREMNSDNVGNFQSIIKFECLLKLYALHTDLATPRVLMSLKLHVLNRCDEICNVVDGLMKAYVDKSPTEIYKATQKYLNIANWLRYFWETPFETMIYYFQNEDWAAAE
jgi:hypothetical protein